MDKNRIILNAIIFFYILQRISEMVLSRYNEATLKENYQVLEVNPVESFKMKLFHTFWFISLIAESNINNSTQTYPFSIVIYLILSACLLIRIHTMKKLNTFWTIKVLSIKKQEIISNGLYKYLRHPNYLVVILEFLFIPLLFNAYWTLTIFSLINFIVLYHRIKLEEEVLMSQSNYQLIFAKTKRLIPFIFTLATCFHAQATEIKVHAEDYDHAKSNASYIRFESSSTKLGLFTSRFDGYAKDIVIHYDSDSNQISKLEVEIPVKGLDTDLNARNSKMHDDIFDVANYPTITVTTQEVIPLQNGDSTINMIFIIKGNKVTKSVKMTIVKSDGKIIIKGSTTLGLKEMQLPDPSISIAKVRDNFDIDFVILL